MKRITAIIAAAGSGSRLNRQTPKQFLDLCGKPMLAWSVAAFHAHPMIDEIILAVPNEYIEFTMNHIAAPNAFPKVKKILPGGRTRQQSVYNALLELDSHTDAVLIHDGARPFVTEAIISNAACAAAEGVSCVPGVKVKDTIKVSDVNSYVLDTPDREALWAIQTPQGFPYHKLLEAHKRAADEGFEGTDDAVLLERMGVKIKIVNGSYVNIKITTGEDYEYAKTFAKNEGNASEENK